MTDLIVACVRTGEYGVTRLRDMVAEHLPRKYTMVCLTDQPERCSGVAFVDISAIGLRGWWGQMVLFEPMWRGRSKVIHLGLNTDIVGDISALADVPGEFSIGADFDTRVMVIGGGMGNFVWSAFERHRGTLFAAHHRTGPSGCIRELYPTPQFLHRVLPPGFFRDRLRLMQVL
jgi:hypothetical protein